MKPTHLITTLFACAGMMSVATAGGINPGNVSADTKWLIHYDADAARDCEIGQWMLDKISDLDERRIRAVERLLSINPLDGLKSVTLYGASANPKDAVLVVRVDHDSDHVGDLIAACPKYSRKGNIHQIEGHHGHTANIILHDNKYLIAAASEATVRGAAALVDGKGKSLEGSKLGGYLAKGDPIFTAWVNADELEMRGRSKMAREVKSMHYVAGEKDGKVGWFLKLEMGGEDTAEMVQKMAEGMLEYAKKDKRAKHPLMQDALAAIESNVKGNNVYMWAAYDNDDVIGLLKDIEEKMKKYKKGDGCPMGFGRKGGDGKGWHGKGGHDGKSGHGAKCPRCGKEGCKGCQKEGGDLDRGHRHHGRDDDDDGHPWNRGWRRGGGDDDDDDDDDDDRPHKKPARRT